jgi:glycosyltransferase involved in cell wall biosynthesis
MLNPPQPDHAAPPHRPTPRSIAYLASTYPTLSMTFVQREVLGLRALGFRIETASINPPDRPPDRLTKAEREEAARTYCVKSHGITGALAAHGKTLALNFAGYCRGATLAIRLGGMNPARVFLHWMYFTEALMVGQWMRGNGQRHLHVHLASQAATVGLFVQSVFRVGFSLSVHGPDEFYDIAGQHLGEKIAAADFLVCISSYTRSQLMNLSPHEHWNKLFVVPLGVDPALFSRQPATPATDPFQILCVGRLTPAKGQHLLLDAVDRIAAEGRPVRLHLVGSGPDEASLRGHATRLAHPDSVVFEGAVNQDRIRSLYAQAHVFCLPSFAEGVPVVLMEAMAMGIPCVSTCITGIPELIRNNIDGLLVAPGDSVALSEALATLMDDRELSERLANSGRARVLEHYNLARNVESLAALFAERMTP